MTKYEKLLNTADSYNLKIHENYDFSGTRIKGLYCDGNIALSNVLKTEAEKRCVLAEEVGHHVTTSGNIIDLHTVQNTKQELKARIWAYKKLVPLQKLILASKAGCRNSFEISEYLNVTEKFLNESLEYYKSHYGEGTIMGSYLIEFEPLLITQI